MYTEAMEKINRKVGGLLISAICSAIALVCGIPMIILGAANGLTALTVIGIILTAFDFYACPVLFSIYGSARSVQRTAKAVNEEHIYDVKNISRQTGKNEDCVKQEIFKCLEKGYISGFLFDGEKLAFNENVKADKQTLYYKCKSCGATVTYFSNEHPPVCPYCGTPHQNASKEQR